MNDRQKVELYTNQVAVLETFLAKGAITGEQYEKSFTDLTDKMFPDGLPGDFNADNRLRNNKNSQI